MIAPWRVVYSETSRGHIRCLHPSIKAVVKLRIEEIQEDPYLGKPLERELAGYYSYRARRFRIIYRIDDSGHVVQVHYVGHRKDIYELFKEMLAETHRTEERPC
jgi:mRNA interferase RelE/StbE